MIFSRKHTALLLAFGIGLQISGCGDDTCKKEGDGGDTPKVDTTKCNDKKTKEECDKVDTHAWEKDKCCEKIAEEPTKGHFMVKKLKMTKNPNPGTDKTSFTFDTGASIECVKDDTVSTIHVCVASNGDTTIAVDTTTDNKAQGGTYKDASALKTLTTGGADCNMPDLLLVAKAGLGENAEVTNAADPVFPAADTVLSFWTKTECTLPKA